MLRLLKLISVLPLISASPTVQSDPPPQLAEHPSSSEEQIVCPVPTEAKWATFELPDTDPGYFDLLVFFAWRSGSSFELGQSHHVTHMWGEEHRFRHANVSIWADMPSPISDSESLKLGGKVSDASTIRSRWMLSGQSARSTAQCAEWKAAAREQSTLSSESAFSRTRGAEKTAGACDAAGIAYSRQECKGEIALYEELRTSGRRVTAR
ncbi:hypothetical protein E5Q_06284 [Mixia osmundae IAM 14324]|uniref:Uncharacterized protein n=1 Tax=Mixia osmundae (strain CBS 9802 / IAM 14324 / JCM 22182 / KY 12970) TaxID=764103 RepID=G7E8W5_MIXOS|nr:hypothetical protein E5Q_06284 [Mixia osmundae IAM 14324]